MSVLKAQVGFPSNFPSLFSAIKHNFFGVFLAQTLYSLVKKVLGSKFVKFLISVLKQQVNSSSSFASFFIVMKHTSSVNFNLINVLLWIKGSYQSPNFETFECSGKNFLNSSCHFLNHKSVFFSNFASLLSVMKHNSSKPF